MKKLKLLIILSSCIFLGGCSGSSGNNVFVNPSNGSGDNGLNPSDNYINVANKTFYHLDSDVYMTLEFGSDTCVLNSTWVSPNENSIINYTYTQIGNEVTLSFVSGYTVSNGNSQEAPNIPFVCKVEGNYLNITGHNLTREFTLKNQNDIDYSSYAKNRLTLSKVYSINNNGTKMALALVDSEWVNFVSINENYQLSRAGLYSINENLITIDFFINSSVTKSNNSIVSESVNNRHITMSGTLNENSVTISTEEGTITLIEGYDGLEDN